MPRSHGAYTRECYVGSNRVAAPSFRKVPRVCLSPPTGKRGLTESADGSVPDLARHLERYAESGRRGLVFVGPKGGKIRRSNFNVI
jgi:hypothetical protein